MMYACSCSLAAVSLITTDANEMLTAYGDRERSRTLYQSTIYLRGCWEGGERPGGVEPAGTCPHPPLFFSFGLIPISGRACWGAAQGRGLGSG